MPVTGLLQVNGSWP